MKSTHIFLSLMSLVACFSINAGRTFTSEQIESFGQNEQDKNGNTRLHRIALRCHNLTYEEFYEQFFEKGGSKVNPLVRNKKGKLAYEIAIEGKCPTLVTALYVGLATGYAQGLEDATDEEIEFNITENK